MLPINQPAIFYIARKRGEGTERGAVVVMDEVRSSPCVIPRLASFLPSVIENLRLLVFLLILPLIGFRIHMTLFICTCIEKIMVKRCHRVLLLPFLPILRIAAILFSFISYRAFSIWFAVMYSQMMLLSLFTCERTRSWNIQILTVILILYHWAYIVGWQSPEEAVSHILYQRS